MTTEQIAALTHVEPPGPSLDTALEQNQEAKNLVAECATDLSTVKQALKQPHPAEPSHRGVKKALEHTEAVELKVEIAIDKLTDVNASLETEITERRMLEAELLASTERGQKALHASLHDPLTGLPNRALFNDRLDHALAQARRHGYALAVMFIDLDKFKAINDTHGHAVGDTVLRTIATRLKHCVRGDDSICRQGGDEFLYVLMGIHDERNMAAIAHKIIKAVQAPIDITVRAAPVTLNIAPSIGISIFEKHGTTAAELIASADQAMYAAKRDGIGVGFADARAEAL